MVSIPRKTYRFKWTRFIAIVAIVLGALLSYVLEKQSQEKSLLDSIALWQKDLAIALLEEDIKSLEILIRAISGDQVEYMQISSLGKVVYSHPSVQAPASCPIALKKRLWYYNQEIGLIEACLSRQKVFENTATSPFFLAFTALVLVFIGFVPIVSLIGYKKELFNVLHLLEAWSASDSPPEMPKHETLINRKDKLSAKIISLVKKVTEQRLEATQKAARDHAISQTVQQIAHDLKNPINVIHLAVEKLSGEKHQLAAISSALAKLKYMVEKFKHADIEGFVRQDWQHVDWSRIINDLKPLAQKSGVTLHGDAAGDQLLHIDRDKIERAVVNLLHNGIESGAANVWLAVSSAGADLTITVADDGPGVPVHIADHIFERGVTGGKPGGSGLGLNFVRETSLGHGGTARYLREQCRSVFEIALPHVVNRPNVDETIPLLSRGNIVTSPDEGGLPAKKSVRVAIKLVSTEKASILAARIQGDFPQVELVDALSGIDFLWSDSKTDFRQALTNRIPTYILSETDDPDAIFAIISNKLKHLTRETV